MVDEVTEMQITLRRQDVQIRRGDVQRFDGFLHIRVQGRNDGHAFGFLNQCLYQRFENMFLGQQVVPVESQQQVTALFQPYGGEPYRLQQTVTVVADGIYQYIAYIMDVFGNHAFLVQVAVGYHACGKQIVGNGIYDGAVYFAGHIHIERTGSGNEVRNFQTALLATMEQLMVAVRSSTTSTTCAG